MTKVFISQPMKDLSPEQIKAERERVIELLKSCYLDDEFEVIPSYFGDEFHKYFEEHPEVNVPLYYLAKSLELLAKADIAVFARGWKEARGCWLEFECAQRYGIECVAE